MDLSPRIESFLSIVAASADKSTAMSHLSSWMIRNLRLNGRPYSFKHHEMQEDIASDQHCRQAIIKCSQCGMTEVSLRLTAAIAAVSRSRIIYVFPSAKFSQAVSTDRFLPIITESPILSAIVHKEAKSSSMRKLGNSTVYFVGASTSTQAISIPATHLILDELDFCDQEVLGMFNSRLRHAEEDPVTGLRGVIRGFSTPTLPNYGISNAYEASDQKGYQVKCEKCNTWQLPSYYKDYVIPGYDGEMALFDATDLDNKSYKIGQAYVKCQCCGGDLWASLLDPTQRQWVAKHPEILDSSGYKVAPIDVPRYNKVPGIFKQIRGYSTQDYYNFVLGLPHADANNSFLMSIFDTNKSSDFITLQEARTLTLSGIRIGVDVGKTSHIVVIQKINSKSMRVLNLSTVTSSPGITIASQVQRYIDAFKPDMTVVDYGPDFSTAQTLLADNTYATLYGCEYKRSISESYSYIDLNDETGVVRADRSGTLSTLMESHNKAHIAYPRHPETNILKVHLETTKKIVKKGEFGDVVIFPKPSQPDHYCHALNYALIADAAVDKEDYLGGPVGVLPGITGVTIGSKVEGDLPSP